MEAKQRPSSTAITASTIRADAPGVTFINVFTVTPDRQQELIEKIEQATKDFFQHQPGYCSVNIHRGLDGTRVVNYVQWESQDQFEALGRHPVAQALRDEIAEIASSESALYDVVAVRVSGD